MNVDRSDRRESNNLTLDSSVPLIARARAAAQLEMARFLEFEAHKAHRAARDIVTTAARSDDFHERLSRAVALAREIGPDQAARQTGFHRQSIEWSLAAARKIDRSRKRDEAIVQIMRLARLGWHNRRIAQAVTKPGGGHYHPGSISRIVQAQLRPRE